MPGRKPPRDGATLAKCPTSSRETTEEGAREAGWNHERCSRRADGDAGRRHRRGAATSDDDDPDDDVRTRVPRKKGDDDGRRGDCQPMLESWIPEAELPAIS